MPDVNPTHPSTQRRRSERVSASVPLIVRGMDLLGQPFEENTSTTTVNLHGCRYSSKHHLPKNTWVTLELTRGPERRNVRARVTWIQRPHSIRESFQIALELESPGNLWGIESGADWAVAPADTPAGAPPRRNPLSAEAPETVATPATTSPLVEAVAPETAAESSHPASTPAPLVGAESVPVSDSPLLNEWKAELDRQAARAADAAAAQAVEKIRRTWEEFDRAESAARESFSVQWAARQQEVLRGLKSEFDQGLRRAQEILQELDGKAQAVRAESEAAVQAAHRIKQTRLQMEAAEIARAQQSSTVSRLDALTEGAAAEWRQRLESETALAKAQWHELLQSSLDSSIERLAERLSSRSQDVLRGADQKLSERLAELREPLGQVSTEAREALAVVKSSLDQEVTRARSALAEIQQSAGRMKEYAAQLEAASQDTVNELHRRLENILEAQTDEIRRRAEHLAAELPQRLAPALDSLGQRLVERTMAEAEARLATRTERIPELLRELAARELQAEESLRLHRERLRQVSENHQREIAGQMAATLAALRGDFESARQDALGKWNEELDAGGVRALHAAADSMGRSSERFQQEARARLQGLADEMLARAGSGFEEKTAEAARQFGDRLEAQSSRRLAEMQQHLEGVAGELSGLARTQLGEAADAAAASFGQVLRGISEQEVRQFTDSSRNALREREQDVARLAEQALRNLEADAAAWVDNFRGQMALQLETTIAEGRSALAAELAAVLAGYRAERAAHETEWAGNLGRMSEEALGRYQDRLQTAGDSWMVASVRRLNEHGQNSIESLMRSADQALRDSCSKVFEGLAEMLRDRATNAAGVVGFTPGPVRDATEAAAAHPQAAAKNPNP